MSQLPGKNLKELKGDAAVTFYHVAVSMHNRAHNERNFKKIRDHLRGKASINSLDGYEFRVKFTDAEGVKKFLEFIKRLGGLEESIYTIVYHGRRRIRDLSEL